MYDGEYDLSFGESTGPTKSLSAARCNVEDNSALQSVTSGSGDAEAASPDEALECHIVGVLERVGKDMIPGTMVSSTHFKPRDPRLPGRIEVNGGEECPEGHHGVLEFEAWYGLLSCRFCHLFGVVTQACGLSDAEYRFNLPKQCNVS